MEKTDIILAGGLPLCLEGISLQEVTSRNSYIVASAKELSQLIIARFGLMDSRDRGTGVYRLWDGFLLKRDEKKHVSLYPIYEGCPFGEPETMKYLSVRHEMAKVSSSLESVNSLMSELVEQLKVVKTDLAELSPEDEEYERKKALLLFERKGIKDDLMVLKIHQKSLKHRLSQLRSLV